MKNEALKMEIFKHKLTQKEIAKKAKFHPSELSQAVNHGLRFPEAREKKLAKALGTTRSAIFNVDGENND